MPEIGVGLAVQRDVVDPHVEVRPVNADKEHHAPERCVATDPRQHETDTDGNLHHARDEDPNRWVAEDRWDDGLKPCGVGEVLDADVDVHPTKHDSGNGDRPVAHVCSPRHEQLNVSVGFIHGHQEFQQSVKLKPKSF